MASSAVSDDEKTRTAQKKCTLCNEFYKNPKILPCFDTFCCSCLKTVVDMWLTKNKDLQSIPCPRCRDEFPLPTEGVEGLKDNMYVDDVVKETSSQLKKMSMCQLCNEGREITTLCYECKDMYCKLCKHIHDRVSGSTHKEKLAEIKNRNRIYLTPSGEPEENDDSYSVVDAYTAVYKPKHPHYVNIQEEKPPLPPRDRTKGGSQKLNLIMPTTSLPNIGVSGANTDYSVPYDHKIPQAIMQDNNSPMSNSKIGGIANRESASMNDLSQYAENPYLFDAVLENYGRLPSPVKKLECSRRDGISLCIARDSQIIIALKDRKKILLTVFSKTGKKSVERALNSELITLACAGDAFLLVADKTKDDVSWTTVENLQIKPVNYVSVRKPVLSKPVPGKNCYIIGRHKGESWWDVHLVDFARNSQFQFRLKVMGDVISFDVSSDGECFAVINDYQSLFLYKKGKMDPDLKYQCQGRDVCFYLKSGREVLLIADSMNDCIVMVDFANGFNVLGRTYVPHPVSLAKDEKGWLWVASICVDNKTEVLMFPS